MTNIAGPEPDDFAYVRQLRHRTRVARDGSWFVLFVFGAVVLIAMFFYRAPEFTSSSGCQPFAHGFVCHVMASTRGFFGSGLGSPFPTGSNVSPWATTYWVVALVLAIVAIVAFYWWRARTSGVVGRLWPFVTVLLAVLILALVSRSWIVAHIPGDFWGRGMQALVVLAVALVVLAAFERTWPFALYVTGFVGLALLSSLYDVSNISTRVGLGSSWGANGGELPNLVLPGAYLLVGGAAFYVVRRRHRRDDVARPRVDDGE